MYFVARTVATAVRYVSAVIGTLNDSMTAVVPRRNRMPANIVPSDVEMTVAMLSASFVMRLMRSPCGWRSR